MSLSEEKREKYRGNVLYTLLNEKDEVLAAQITEASEEQDLALVETLLRYMLEKQHSRTERIQQAPLFQKMEEVTRKMAFLDFNRKEWVEDNLGTK